MESPLHQPAAGPPPRAGEDQVEPDLAVWPKHIRPRSVRGPDLLLLIEVADSSLSYDLKTKAALYATHGVRAL